MDNYYTNGPSLNIKKNVIRSSNGKYLCSDKFPVHHKLNPCTGFKGKENTDILAGLGTTNTAANAARKYKPYDGDTLEWYLPSIRELAVYYHDFNKINAAIAKAGGLKLSDGYYWSSSEYSSKYALNLFTNYGGLSYDVKGVNFYVRPFALI